MRPLDRPAGYSILAFVECAFATGGLAYAVISLNARMYLLTAVLIAPLMLLQTAYGTAIKSRLFKLCEPFFRPAIVRMIMPKLAFIAGVATALYAFESPNFEGEGFSRFLGVILLGTGVFMIAFVAFAVLWIGALALVSLLIRFSATLAAFCRQPGDCLLAIPQNWNRVCFKTDFRTPPELFPGAETVEQYSIRRYFLRFRDELLLMSHKDRSAETQWLLRMVRAVEAAFRYTLVYVGAGVATALLFLAAASYRISLKSTFVVYLPFFYFASPALFERQSLDFLRGILASVSDKVIAVLIVATHVLLPVAVAFLVGATVMSQPRDSLVRALMDYWSFTPILSANAITKIANALLVFVCLGLAHLGMRWLVEENHTAARRTTAALRLLIALRALLTVYSIFYVAVLIAYHVNADQAAAGWQGVVRALQAVRVDWTPLPGAPD